MIAGFRASWNGALWTIALVSLSAPPAIAAQEVAETNPGEVRLSLIYTGRSLGALGVLRDPDEHELLIEQAQRSGDPLQLATYRCWRASSVTIFSPSSDLDLEDLITFLADDPSGTNGLQTLSVLRSNNVTMLQPEGESPDLLEMVKNNPRMPIDFPDLVPASALLMRSQGADGEPILVVMEGGMDWPDDPDEWTEGEVNRLDVGDATLYELAVNLGQIGPRATLIRGALATARAHSSHPILIDLGERDGDLGLERPDRARLDYTALSSLGYSFVVPYELELALGAEGLADLQGHFPDIRFLAANVAGKTEKGELFVKRHVIEIEGVKVGFFGIVDPDLRGVLASSALVDFTFEDPVDVATRETATLRAEGADAVIMLSNLHPRDNALVSREVMGMDAVVADLHVRWSPEEVKTEVTLPGRPRSRPGSPALVPRSFANGLGVGRLDMVFRTQPEGGFFLSLLSHELESVTDRTPADAEIVTNIREMLLGVGRPRGEVLLPAFEDLVERRPSLADFDEESARGGRISKRMWEEFLARLVRFRAGAEVAIIRKLPHFPPAIGELHEAEIRSWLWTEDAIVVLDLSGADLKAILAEDIRDDLRTSGVNRQANLVRGRPIRDLTFYRVATTDLLFEGARFRRFERARRVKRSFKIEEGGRLDASGSSSPLLLRDFVLSELKRLRDEETGEAYVQRVARLLDKDPPFEPLFTFTFDRPTVFASFNRVSENREFGSVPESRVTSTNSSVVGTTARFLLGLDLERYGIDLGVVTAFSRQKITVPPSGRRIVVEPSDDLQFDLRVRRKLRRGERWQLQPYGRTVFDTEFTPTVNLFTGETNPHQKVVRAEGGFLLVPGGGWNTLELGVMFEEDLTANSFETGLRLSADYRKRFGALGRLSYRLSNDVKYFFPEDSDDETDLAFTYRLINEILVPLVDELSLSVALDVFAFKGKIPLTDELGASVIMRIGLTYDRLWKPLYQPFF